MLEFFNISKLSSTRKASAIAHANALQYFVWKLKKKIKTQTKIRSLNEIPLYKWKNKAKLKKKKLPKITKDL